MPLLDPLIPSSADVVAVFDQNFTQVFPLARPVNAKVKENKKVMEHPLETGETVSDHAIIEPIEIELALVLQGPDFRSVYQQIRQAFRASTLFTIQTRTGSYRSMVMQSMPHDETNTEVDIIAVALTFKEAMFVTARTGKLPPAKVKDKNKQSTVDAGNKQPKAAAPPQPSILKRVFGEKMPQQIDLQAIPNQSLSVRLDDAFYELLIQEVNGEMVITITRNSELLIRGQRMVSEYPLLPYRYKEDGNFYVSNMNEEIIYYDQFNVTQFLLFFTAAELLEIRNA